MMISSEPEDSKWFVLYTNSRAEKKVAERLMKNRVETFLPLITSVKQWSDRKKKVKVPLISSCVFVKTHSKKLNNLLNIHGVVTILKYLGKPAIVKGFEISNLKIVANNTEEINLIDSIDLKKGQDVEVINGPFSGLLAKYIDFAGKHRVIVELEALKSCIEVNIPLSNIRKV